MDKMATWSYINNLHKTTGSPTNKLPPKSEFRDNRGKCLVYLSGNQLIEESELTEGVVIESEEEVNLLKILFIQDINLLIKMSQVKIKKGATLQSLFALTQFSPELSKVGTKLSRTYRQVLLSEDILGFIPQKRYQEWSKDVKEFYDTFCSYVFNETYGETSVLDKI